MGKNKLIKFEQLSSFPNTYQNYSVSDSVTVDHQGKVVDLKGRWHADHFHNQQPITLELACGRGEYTVGLGELYSNRNFIGIDIKGARIWQGAKIAMENGWNHVAFLRTRIEKLAAFFAPGEVDEIWITFADPFLKKPNRRLTSGYFLQEYQKVLKPDGLVHLKTDSDRLYEFTLRSIEAHGCTLLENYPDIYFGDLPMPELGIKTYYERMHLEAGKRIKYLRFQLPETPISPIKLKDPKPEAE
ncbi:MAG: tRNA (guanosine(46)-N7)-methyltransferase TrmB [Bacteroidota bacterium]